MEKEKRLIDAGRFREVLLRYLHAPHMNSYMRLAVETCVELLDTQRKVDAVEVVRCKDCFADGCCSVQIDLEMGGEGYCSKGKRRTDNG